MSKINFYDIDDIRNINEKRVWDLLSEFLKDNVEYCTCRDCVLDYAVITLNNIKPHYQVTDERLENIAKKTSNDEILAEILKAAKIVKNNPHHL